MIFIYKIHIVNFFSFSLTYSNDLFYLAFCGECGGGVLAGNDLELFS